MIAKKMKVLLTLSAAVMTAGTLFAQVPAPEAAAQIERSTKTEKSMIISKDLEVPYISIYYVEPNILTTQDVKISFYVTDWHQSEIRLMDKSKRFNAFLILSDTQKNIRKFDLKKIPAGDHSFKIGKLPEGDYTLRLYAIDERGRYTPSIFHEFRVRKTYAIPAEETYRMTPADLQQYKINNRGNYGELHFVDAAGKKADETKAIVEAAAANLKPADGKYLIVAGGSKAPADLLIGKQCGAYDLPVPEWLPNYRGRESAKILYSPTYNRERVEQESFETGRGINQMLADLRKKGIRKVVFLPGVYRISVKSPLTVPSGMTVDLNGATLKLHENTEKGGIIIQIRHCYDSHVMNGIVEGDYFEHDYSVNKHSEWVSGIEISGGSKYCSYKNLVVRYITGYGVQNGFSGVDTRGFAGLKFTPGTLNRVTGKEIQKAGLQISQMVSVKTMRERNGYTTASRILGYQGRAMDEWNVMFHFFDHEKKYLETIDSVQYRRVRIPENAHFARVTVWAAGKIKDHVSSNFFRVPQNCSYENLLIQNARCVGMAPSGMYNHKIANCTFTRSGENLAKCAFDAEDGWDMMQDVWIYRNRFIGNHHNELLTCAGHNFVIEENEASLYFWSRTNSYVVRNNKLKSAGFGYGGRKRTGLPRVENNTCAKTMSFGDSNGDSMLMMRLYADELAGKGKTLESRWQFMVRGNFANGSVKTNNYAVLYGSELDKMPNFSSFNLLMSRLQNTSVNVLAGSNFLNSILENCKFTLYKASKKIVNCKFKNAFFNLSNGSELILENCTLEDVQLHHGYWILPAKVTLINCTVKNKDLPLFKTPSYSTGVITIENCRIETGAAPMFNMYDTRAQKTDKEPGFVNLKNSVIENTAGCIVQAKGTNNQKVITFSLNGVRHPGKVVSEPSAKWKVDIAPMAAFKSIPRGWDQSLEPKILKLISENKTAQ